jgi:hypothetical protein
LLGEVFFTQRGDDPLQRDDAVQHRHTDVRGVDAGLPFERGEDLFLNLSVGFHGGPLSRLLRKTAAGLIRTRVGVSLLALPEFRQLLDPAILVA